MKHLLSLTLAGVAFGAALPAAAIDVGPTPVSGTATINGSVLANCVLAASDPITLGQLANLSDGKYNGVADTKKATLAGFCNGTTSTMTVVANPIVLTSVHSAPPTGFTDTVDYTATASLNTAAGATVSTSDSTTGSPAAAAAVSLFSGNVTVTLSSSTAGENKLIAGPYQGTTVVTLTPAA
jgi:hypothetical protein